MSESARPCPNRDAPCRSNPGTVCIFLGMFILSSEEVQKTSDSEERLTFVTEGPSDKPLQIHECCVQCRGPNSCLHPLERQVFRRELTLCDFCKPGKSDVGRESNEITKYMEAM